MGVVARSMAGAVLLVLTARVPRAANRNSAPVNHRFLRKQAEKKEEEIFNPICTSIRL